MASKKQQLQLDVLEYRLSICKVSEVPTSLLEQGFACIARTDDEVSVVCETSNVPTDATKREDGWRTLKVRGPLDFELVGIMAKISSALAEAEVPLFALSTFDTDYVLVKDDMLKTTIKALCEQGCEIHAVNAQ